jgi:uncharacterized protein YdhG (YjbR/CyaY superfamily)
MPNTPDTIDAYMAGLPEVSRKIISTIRQMIATVAPEGSEGIKYGMPTSALNGTNIIYYAAWKKHVALYPIYPGPQEFETAIAAYRDTKDNVRFPLNLPMPYDVVDLILSQRIAQLRARARSATDKGADTAVL